MLKASHLFVDLDHTRVLEDITFSAEPGKILSIIGPNGAGKTTLLRAISGLIPVRQGNVSLKDRDLLALSVIDRGRLVASVPQASNLPPAFRVHDVVLLGRTPYLNWLGQTSQSDEMIVQEALKQTDTVGLKEKLISELSAGEQQRILLARALAQNTPVLLMDEPTSHLDLKYQVELLELTKNLTHAKKLITLLVLHDLNLAGKYSDHILLLNHGSMVAMGKPENIFTRQILSRVYQLPVVVKKQRHSLLVYPE